MKQLTLFCIAILFTLAASAQTNYSVPELTDQQKHQVAKGLCFNNIIVAISYAKSLGQTIEDYAKYGAGLIKPYYKDMGFDAVVRDQLSTWPAMAGNVEILSQSENKIRFRISQVLPALETQGQIWNVSFEEMMKWLEMLYAIPCETIGISYSMNFTDQGFEITIEKK